ncbi:hypothetical protein CHUAL_008814 [Chamberlinius hualienensis]
MYLNCKMNSAGAWAVAIVVLLIAAPVYSQIKPPISLKSTIVEKDASVQENARRIQNSLLYPYEYFKPSELGDYNPLIQWNLKFPIPFYGFLFNYTWVSLNGHLAFSRSPSVSTRPLKVPIDDWPLKPDPSFIAPFHMEAAIGETQNANDLQPGVYVRMIADIGMGNERPPDWTQDQTRNEENAIKQALTRDIQDGIIGAEYFEPKHVIIVTWRNVTFNGGTSGTKTITNTFQVVLATDEIISYCMFNYDQLKWTSATNAGGGPGDGLGGIPAFVGFNAGNGSRAFEYMPYSQTNRINNLITNGYANGKPGRHIFRIDEQIYQGVCNYEPGMGSAGLFLSPNSGNMLGGVLVNMTGPCFDINQRIKARFKDVEVTCEYKDRNHATCITPQLFYIGYIDVVLTIGDGAFQFKTQFYLEPPSESKEVVYVKNREVVHDVKSDILEIVWSAGNLTYNPNVPVSISLWGFREDGPVPQLVYIDTLVDSTPNRGNIILNTADYAERDNSETRDLGFGFIQINLTNPNQEGYQLTPQLWSHPMPLAWYFYPQWEENDGPEWARMACDNWIQREDRLNTFSNHVTRCPCTLGQALADMGNFGPDPECDMNLNTGCYSHKEAKHCVRSGVSTYDGNGQQCCYDNDNYLILTADTPFGGVPARSHPFGGFPYFDVGKVPSLSHWSYDVMPYYFCCRWQDSETEGCWTYRSLRSSNDCKGYQTPNATGVFGDPHLVTFDFMEYTFNGLGEYVLTRVNDRWHQLDIQGRFQQIVDTQRAKRLPASELTAVAMKENTSSVVEIQLRNIEARWRYRLDVLVDHNRVYFDRPHQKIQAFRGVTVYVPGNIHNQSLVIVQFQSGAGIAVYEGNGHMAATILLPQLFMNSTRGLSGNWTGTADDDFTLPDGEVVLSPQAADNNFRTIHEQFGLKWAVKDSEDVNSEVGKSLFFHEYGRSSNSYYNETFQPVFEKKPMIYSNSTLTEEKVKQLCSYETSYTCYYDYIVSGNKDFAATTLQNEMRIKTLKTETLTPIATCGQLLTPRHGHKSTRQYILGTRVKFFCEETYLLEGDEERYCENTGKWNEEDWKETICIGKSRHFIFYYKFLVIAAQTS